MMKRKRSYQVGNRPGSTGRPQGSCCALLCTLLLFRSRVLTSVSSEVLLPSWRRGGHALQL